MKKIIIGLVLLFVLAINCTAVFEIENDAEKFLVTLINQEPDPVEPSNIVDVRFRVENKKFQIAPNVEVKLELNYPFSLYGTEEPIKNIGTLAPGQAGETGVRVKYRLFVDKGAAEGENKIAFWYRIDGGPWQKAGDYIIDVRSRDAVLAINEVTTDRDKILPGTKTKVTFKLENYASTSLTNVKLELQLLTPLVTTTSVSYAELPFSPLGSGNEKTVDYIAPGKSESISFNLFTDADADSKVYKVPYSLAYTDEAGTNFSRSGIVGLMVDAEPDISINLDDTTIYQAGQKGTITLKFVNKGFSDIKFLDVNLKESSEFDIISNPEEYIGNIDSDDYETAEFEIMVSKDAKNSVKLPLHVEYRDANGQLYEKNPELSLELFSGNELKQRTGGSSNPYIGPIVVVLLIAVGIIIWRWMKKRKQHR